LSRLAAKKVFFSYSVDWQQKFVDERVVRGGRSGIHRFLMSAQGLMSNAVSVAAMSTAATIPVTTGMIGLGP